APLPRQVKLFGAVSLLNDFASEMVYPLLPAFVTGVLGGGAVALGALDGAADAAAALVKLVAGRLADRPSRRGPLIVIGYFVPGVIVVLLAIWTVRDGKGRYGTVRVNTPSEPLPSLTVPYRPLPSYVIAIGVFYLIRMPETLMILRAQQLGIAVALVPLLWAALHVIRSSTSFVGGALSDRIGPSRTMWIGWLSYVALAAGFAFATSPLTAWVLFLAL